MAATSFLSPTFPWFARVLLFGRHALDLELSCATTDLWSAPTGGSGAFDTMRRAPSKTTPLSAGASFASHRTPAPSGGFSGQAGSAVSVRGEVGVSGGAAAAGRRVSGDGRSPDRHGPVNRGGSGKGGLEKQVQAARVAARRRGSMGSGGGF
jgi:hypothetical protein